MKTNLVACCVLALAGFALKAATVDDVIAMAQKGEPEDKQVALVDNTPGEITIGASDVLRLREARVPEKVIVAMLRHVPKNAPNTQVAGRPIAPQTYPAQPPQGQQGGVQQNPNQYGNTGNPTVRVPVAPRIPSAPPIQQGQPGQAGQQPQLPMAAPAPIRNPNQDGQLTIENLDDRAWSYMYEPAIQTIWIAYPGQGSVVQAHASTTLSMHPGHYSIRFSGTQEGGYPLAINGGERSAINVSRVVAEGHEALNVSLFENGERRASGNLVALNNLPLETVTSGPTYVQGPTYYSAPPVYYTQPYYYGGILRTQLLPPLLWWHIDQSRFQLWRWRTLPPLATRSPCR